MGICYETLTSQGQKIVLDEQNIFHSDCNLVKINQRQESIGSCSISPVKVAASNSYSILKERLQRKVKSHQKNKEGVYSVRKSIFAQKVKIASLNLASLAKDIDNEIFKLKKERDRLKKKNNHIKMKKNVATQNNMNMDSPFSLQSNIEFTIDRYSTPRTEDHEKTTCHQKKNTLGLQQKAVDNVKLRIPSVKTLKNICELGKDTSKLTKEPTKQPIVYFDYGDCRQPMYVCSHFHTPNNYNTCTCKSGAVDIPCSCKKVCQHYNRTSNYNGLLCNQNRYCEQGVGVCTEYNYCHDEYRYYNVGDSNYLPRKTCCCWCKKKQYEGEQSHHRRTSDLETNQFYRNISPKEEPKDKTKKYTVSVRARQKLELEETRDGGRKFKKRQQSPSIDLKERLRKIDPNRRESSRERSRTQKPSITDSDLPYKKKSISNSKSKEKYQKLNKGDNNNLGKFYSEKDFNEAYPPGKYSKETRNALKQMDIRPYEQPRKKDNTISEEEHAKAKKDNKNKTKYDSELSSEKDLITSLEEHELIDMSEDKSKNYAKYMDKYDKSKKPKDLSNKNYSKYIDNYDKDEKSKDLSNNYLQSEASKQTFNVNDNDDINARYHSSSDKTLQNVSAVIDNQQISDSTQKTSNKQNNDISKNVQSSDQISYNSHLARYPLEKVNKENQDKLQTNAFEGKPTHYGKNDEENSSNQPKTYSNNEILQNEAAQSPKCIIQQIDYVSEETIDSYVTSINYPLNIERTNTNTDIVTNKVSTNDSAQSRLQQGQLSPYQIIEKINYISEETIDTHRVSLISQGNANDDLNSRKIINKDLSQPKTVKDNTYQSSGHQIKEVAQNYKDRELNEELEHEPSYIMLNDMLSKEGEKYTTQEDIEKTKEKQKDLKTPHLQNEPLLVHPEAQKIPEQRSSFSDRQKTPEQRSSFSGGQKLPEAQTKVPEQRSSFSGRQKIPEQRSGRQLMPVVQEIPEQISVLSDRQKFSKAHEIPEQRTPLDDRHLLPNAQETLEQQTSLGRQNYIYANMKFQETFYIPRENEQLRPEWTNQFAEYFKPSETTGAREILVNNDTRTDNSTFKQGKSLPLYYNDTWETEGAMQGIVPDNPHQTYYQRPIDESRSHQMSYNNQKDYSQNNYDLLQTYENGIDFEQSKNDSMEQHFEIPHNAYLKEDESRKTEKLEFPNTNFQALETHDKHCTEIWDRSKQKPIFQRECVQKIRVLCEKPLGKEVSAKDTVSINYNYSPDTISKNKSQLHDLQESAHISNKTEIAQNIPYHQYKSHYVQQDCNNHLHSAPQCSCQPMENIEHQNTNKGNNFSNIQSQQKFKRNIQNKQRCVHWQCDNLLVQVNENDYNDCSEETTYSMPNQPTYPQEEIFCQQDYRETPNVLNRNNNPPSDANNQRNNYYNNYKSYGDFHYDDEFLDIDECGKSQQYDDAIEYTAKNLHATRNLNDFEDDEDNFAENVSKKYDASWGFHKTNNRNTFNDQHYGSEVSSHQSQQNSSRIPCFENTNKTKHLPNRYILPENTNFEDSKSQSVNYEFCSNYSYRIMNSCPCCCSSQNINATKDTIGDFQYYPLPQERITPTKPNPIVGVNTNSVRGARDKSPKDIQAIRRNNLKQNNKEIIKKSENTKNPKYKKNTEIEKNIKNQYEETNGEKLRRKNQLEKINNEMQIKNPTDKIDDEHHKNKKTETTAKDNQMKNSNEKPDIEMQLQNLPAEPESEIQVNQIQYKRLIQEKKLKHQFEISKKDVANKNKSEEIFIEHKNRQNPHTFGNSPRYMPLPRYSLEHKTKQTNSNQSNAITTTGESEIPVTSSESKAVLAPFAQETYAKCACHCQCTENVNEGPKQRNRLSIEEPKQRNRPLIRKDIEEPNNLLATMEITNLNEQVVESNQDSDYATKKKIKFNEKDYCIQASSSKKILTRKTSSSTVVSVDSCVKVSSGCESTNYFTSNTTINASSFYTETTQKLSRREKKPSVEKFVIPEFEGCPCMYDTYLNLVEILKQSEMKPTKWG